MSQVQAHAVSYTHLRAHETGGIISYAVFCLKKKKKKKKRKKKKNFFFFFFNDTATTEIYTQLASSAASDVYKRQRTPFEGTQ